MRGRRAANDIDPAAQMVSTGRQRANWAHEKKLVCTLLASLPVRGDVLIRSDNRCRLWTECMISIGPELQSSAPPRACVACAIPPWSANDFSPLRIIGWLIVNWCLHGAREKAGRPSRFGAHGHSDFVLLLSQSQYTRHSFFIFLSFILTRNSLEVRHL